MGCFDGDGTAGPERGTRTRRASRLMTPTAWIKAARELEALGLYEVVS